MWSSALAYTLILSLTCLSFYGLVSFGDEGFDTALLFDSYLHSILGFTVKQAALSALISVGLAIPIAYLIHCLPDLKGKALFLRFCLLCFVTPTLIIITGLVALLGRSGSLTPWITEYLNAQWNLYGLNGILIAHVFMNMPLAIRVISLQLQSIPDTSYRLAQQLKLAPYPRFRLIEWPVIRQASTMLLGFIFVLCFNSFAVVLALGGGPKSTTLEVAIYQAIKYDFNIPEALTLAWIQLIIAGILYATFSKLGSVSWQTVTTHPSFSRSRSSTSLRTALLSFTFYSLWGVLLLPFAALITNISSESFSFISLSSLLRPALISLLLASVSALLALALAYPLLHTIRLYTLRKDQFRSWLFDQLATHTLIAPAIVLSVGLFVFFLPLVDLDRYGIVFIILLNALLVLPFAIQKLKPRLLQYDQQYARLSVSLKLSTQQQRKLEWPFIKQVYLSTAGLVLLLAIGDVAVFSLFGSPEWTTLPWLIYSLAGSYRIEEASAASFVLLLICAAALWLIESSPTTGKGYAKD